MGSIRSPGSEDQETPRRGSLARRLSLALMAMLVALVAVAAARVLTFGTSMNELEEFRAETVGEAARIDEVRRLLVKADDAGEAYVETEDPVNGSAFLTISKEIDRRFIALKDSGGPREKGLTSSARAEWQRAVTTLELALRLPAGGNGDRLDPFHDSIDTAASLLADEFALNVQQVGDEITALRVRERRQLSVSLAILVMGVALGGYLSRRVYRSVAVPLRALEEAAEELGAEYLSHRIDVHGNDELARVGNAFNSMADKLQHSRAELKRQALHDPLTGLPNRALFIEQFQHALVRARRSASAVSVLYLDLDGFKGVNDTLGHEGGDELLVGVAERLRAAVRDVDTLARLGGDEFGIVMDEGLAGATFVADRILTEFQRPWPLAAGSAAVGVSIGIATRSGDEELDELLREADTAMYAAKADGKNRWQVFRPDEELHPATPETPGTVRAR